MNWRRTLGLFLLVVGVPVIALGLIGAGAGLGADTPKPDDQGCPVKDGDWTRTGQANQRGYNFEFQSGRGSDCRVYRVRNSEKLLTPIVWEQKKEIFLETNLPPCKKEKEPCDWVRAIKVWGKSEKGKTTLGYGVNRDEAHEDVEAWRREVPEEDCGKEAESSPPILTSIQGFVAPPPPHDTEVVLVDVTVSATLAEGGRVIRYSVKLGNKMEGTVEIREKRPEAGPERGYLTLVWESAPPEFYKVLAKSEKKTIKPGSSVDISVAATEGVSTKEGTLTLYVGKELLAKTTAPAYVPKGN